MSRQDYPSTVAGLSAGLARGEFSSRELVAHCLARIRRQDAALNSFIMVIEDRAFAAADAADARRRAGEAGPLTGIPYANKDIFCTKGVRTTCASRMLDNFIAPYDATVVSRLAEAGMVMVGKTNMDEFAMGSSNETSYYGPCRNPWGVTRVPGGSSGGSASAVAARLVPFATGTDTGGSIRLPAAYCGISGLKPTYGRVSRYGMVAFASSLDQAGPMALTAEDLALTLNAMCGVDARDGTSADVPAEDFSRSLAEPLTGLRIGLPREFFDASLSPAIAAPLQAAIRVLEQLGARCMEVSLPTTRHAIPAYYIIASAECSSNLSRYDGVRFGHRCEAPRDLNDLYTRSRAEGFGAEVKRRILMGTYALSTGYYDAYYAKAQQLRRLIRDDFIRVFNEVDVILGPTAPTTAFGVGQKTADPVEMYLSDIYTTAVNLAGLPGLSVPAGFVDGLPVGLQMIGRHFDEATLLKVANRFQLETDWHQHAPTLKD
ncbi:MAG: Asp-tRNA(Asn)/Glu-tRNA(Gln) amidotransferase subunit GatA [Gammaproteobacteria bacterium]|nr:Asp-tRNA(Asn)/Glu-tRNA(Gln) amidotransferase subunit GatA [Gammaproteobacteria bacterium]